MFHRDPNRPPDTSKWLENVGLSRTMHGQVPVQSRTKADWSRDPLLWNAEVTEHATRDQAIQGARIEMGEPVAKLANPARYFERDYGSSHAIDTPFNCDYAELSQVLRLAD